MARIFECDRCGEISRLPAPDLPKGWMRLETATRNVSNPHSERGIFEEGDFCRGCAMDLIEWRQPLPRAKPRD